MDSTSLTMPEAMHDRRDVVGTLEPVVTLPRDLAERALIDEMVAVLGGHG